MGRLSFVVPSNMLVMQQLTHSYMKRLGIPGAQTFLWAPCVLSADEEAGLPVLPFIPEVLAGCL